MVDEKAVAGALLGKDYRVEILELVLRAFTYAQRWDPQLGHDTVNLESFRREIEGMVHRIKAGGEP